MAQKEKREQDNFYVVGVGASAGGLEALQDYFKNVPDNTGAAYVVIQHLSPDYKSLMDELLSRCTGMPVKVAEDGIEVKKNHVYLIPPKKELKIRDRRLHLSDQPHETRINLAIDTFFKSLSEECGKYAIAVVLSGAGSDGTLGIRYIKENGGMIMVQEPHTAAFNSMPLSAIATGLVDYVLEPDAMGAAMISYIEHPFSKAKMKGEQRDENEVFQEILDVLQAKNGIDFTNYKRTTVLRRIERRMVVTHSSGLAGYVELLKTSPEEAGILVKEILIGVTNFFRDSAFFEKLKQHVIYNIVERAGEKDPIRVWSAGCSTGEEAYSLAILFREVLDELNIHRDVKIFATDVDVKAIEQAGKGVFTESILDDVSTERLAKFFTKKNEQYVISKEIRRMIIFAPHNMLSDPPFGKLDLISCRNVMIYFQPVLQRTLFAIFHSALKKGGYLFLGKSETAGEYGNVFRTVCSAEKIYVHKGEGKVDEFIPPSFHIPNVHTVSPRVSSVTDRETGDYAMESTYTQFLENFLPASVVLNEANNVIHFFGNYQDYLSIAPGKATFNFFSMIHKDLSLVASTALNRCRMEHITVTYTGIAMDCPEGRRNVNLTVSPVTGNSQEDMGLVAVLFTESGNSVPDGVTEKYDVDTTAARRIADLEQELHESQNDLKSTIGELETVNEELQAANEELLTANEELQSSNEELQSVNEELYTVNTEYQQKLDELTMLTNDLSNFLSSTMIGILFVDSNLNIRKFTEYVGREFQLMEHDVGRSFQIFAHSFPEEDIVQDARDVLKDLVPIDREVSAMNGRYYTLRIAPYRTTENSIRGLVITIIDSLGTEQKKAE